MEYHWRRRTRRFPAPRIASILTLLAVISLAGCRDRQSEPTQGHSDSRAFERLRIATWNISWLAATPGKGQIRRTSADYEQLGHYAATVSADIIAVQEIASEDGLWRIFDPQSYRVMLAKQKLSQRVGFVFRRDLKVVRYEDVTELGGRGLRYGVDVGVLVGDREVRLLAVHLKSGCFSEPLRTRKSKAADACRKLAAQLPHIQDWIADRTREGTAFVILGDFNRRLRSGEAVWQKFRDRSAGLTLATDGIVSSCWGGRYPELIDHIIVDRQSAAWMVPGSVQVHNYRAQGAKARSRLSDHCAISTVLAFGDEKTVDPIDDLATEVVATDEAGAGRGQASTQAGNRGSANEPAGKGGASIKGNISRGGRKLYHLPQCGSYKQVKIEPDRGERWFTTEYEAKSAGFVRAGNCP